MWSKHDALGKARKALSRHKEVLLKVLDQPLNEARHGERLPSERGNKKLQILNGRGRCSFEQVPCSTFEQHNLEATVGAKRSYSSFEQDRFSSKQQFRSPTIVLLFC